MTNYTNNLSLYIISNIDVHQLSSHFVLFSIPLTPHPKQNNAFISETSLESVCIDPIKY